MQDVYKNIEEYNLGKKHKALIAFDDMIPDMINNKELNPIIYQRQKIKHCNCFYYTIIFYSTKRNQTKHYAFFYYENSKQKRTSTNYIKSFIRY